MYDLEEMVEIGGYQLRVSVRGDGPPILMFNGLGGHIEIYDNLRKSLKGFRTIAYDVPGVGKSEPVRGILRMRHHADIAAKVLDHLNVEVADIFGTSWGGALAQEFTFRHPARVRRVVLAATTTGPGMLTTPDVYLAFLDPRTRNSDHYVNHTAPKLFGGKVRKEARELLESGVFSFLTKKASKSYYTQMAAAIGWSSLPFLWRINKPVLILAGTDDPLIRTYNANILNILLRGSELRLIEGEGHFFIVTSAVETASYVHEFLTRDTQLDTAVIKPKLVLAA
jgi:pimeloyl-ACP methyl ester carboxylesterase